jgi:methylenetetrahydrofolate reductase (NADPH)
MLKRNEFHISFEFFPPKSAEGMINLKQIAKELAAYQPQFFSVTYGAAGSTRNGTIESVCLLQEATTVPVAPHLACVGSSRADMVKMIEHYQTLGVDRIVALRGDLPSGMGQGSEFRFATDLVALLREIAGKHFHIEVAAYPEFHPQALSAYHDIDNLKRKQEMGANSAITQYFFNPDAYFYYLDDCAKKGIRIPIIPGIMPITQFTSLLRFSNLCGAEIPQWLRRRLESFGDDVAAIQAFGTEVVTKLCERLLTGGAPGLHFYTLNRVDSVNKIAGQLSGMRSSEKSQLTSEFI